jgi:hypothetical protein
LRPILRVPNDLVDEVAEVEDEAQSFGGIAPFVVHDHTTIRITRAQLHVLATDECEARRTSVSPSWRGERPANPAAEAALVGEAIPVLAAWQKTGD